MTAAGPEVAEGHRMTDTETLARRRIAYVRATVVRAQEPTSARPGDSAVILADGSIEGFVGGVCAENSVRLAALDTLRDGETLLLRVLPDHDSDFPDTPGARVVVNPCHSGGALEIFLQPMLPRPVLQVVGDTPISRAVGTLAAFLEFDLETVDPGRAGAGWADATAVVVAGLGRGEQDAIRAALDAGVGFIALVASHIRGAVVLDEMGVTEVERRRVHTPAGLNIGARTPPEIALSIMSEVIQAIRTEGLAPAAQPSPAQPSPAQLPDVPLEAVDPVCGMTVVTGPDTLHAAVGDEDFWFCRAGCRDTFLKQAA
jgi:xanthine dehydrogenase accessory factor